MALDDEVLLHYVLHVFNIWEEISEPAFYFPLYAHSDIFNRIIRKRPLGCDNRLLYRIPYACAVEFNKFAVSFHYFKVIHMNHTPEPLTSVVSNFQLNV